MLCEKRRIADTAGARLSRLISALISTLIRALSGRAVWPAPVISGGRRLRGPRRLIVNHGTARRRNAHSLVASSRLGLARLIRQRRVVQESQEPIRIDACAFARQVGRQLVFPVRVLVKRQVHQD